MKTETGLTKPPLILGLDPSHLLGVPLCMTTDIMHLAGNISDLLISLWCGEMDIGPGDDKSTWEWAVFRDENLWVSHGEDIAAAGSSSLVHTTANHAILPRRSIPRVQDLGIPVIHVQYRFHPSLQYTSFEILVPLLPAHSWIPNCMPIFSNPRTAQRCSCSPLCLERNFELFYYQLCHNCIHFVRPAVHQVIHLVPEAFQKGPPICYAQWTME